jgi:hypothetical protein
MVIFLILMIGFKLVILGLWLTISPSYAIGYYFELIIWKNISHILKYIFWTRLRIEPVRMRIVFSQMRVEPTRSMVRLQCHGECWFGTHTGCRHVVCVEITSMSVKIRRSVPKSHAWCENHTCACGIAVNQTPIRIFLVILH